VSAFAEVARLPIVPRCAISGSLIGAVVGGMIGLILGIRANLGTAWFAVFEIGLPGAVCGGLIGTLTGLGIWARRRVLQASPD
jgi:uncharacterized protein YcfJ